MLKDITVFSFVIKAVLVLELISFRFKDCGQFYLVKWAKNLVVEDYGKMCIFPVQMGHGLL